MPENNFRFLEKCLDALTLEYATEGMNLSPFEEPLFTVDSFKHCVEELLGVTQGRLLEAPYEISFLNAFKNYEYKKKATKQFKKLNFIGNFGKGFLGNQNNSIQILEELLQNMIDISLNNKRWSQQVFEFSMRFPRNFWPYLWLYIIVPTHLPKWTLITNDSLAELFTYTSSGSLYLVSKTLQESWQITLNTLFKDKKESQNFAQLLFLLSLFTVIRTEISLCNTGYSLDSLMPLKMPDSSSSLYLFERIDKREKESALEKRIASLLIGVYKASNRKDKSIDELISDQEAGNNITGIEQIKPMLFTTWQADAILKNPAMLNPFFAYMSALKYRNNEEEIARMYFEYIPYGYKANILNKSKKLLLLNHFFPYVTIDRNTTIKKEGKKLPMTLPDGKEGYSFVPKIVSGINLGLIDMLYLHFNYFPQEVMKELTPEDEASFDCIQAENVDAGTALSFHRYLSSTGIWKLVKNKFESEVELRVRQQVRQLRHDINHFLGPVEGTAQDICEYLMRLPENSERNYMIEYAKEIIKDIDMSFLMLDEAIEINDSQPYKAPFNDTINQFISRLPKNQIEIIYNKTNVSDDFEYCFLGKNGISFYRMFENIINNAFTHGFSTAYGTTIKNPVVLIEGEISDNMLILRIKNNGEPKPDLFDVNAYITSGVSNKKGHTGLGGYEIDRIARLHSGQLNISSSKEWGFIVEIYFKLK